MPLKKLKLTQPRKFKKVISLTLTIFLILSAAFSVTIVRQVQNYIKNEHDKYSLQFDLHVEATATMAESIFNSVINTPEVIALFRQGVMDADLSAQQQARESLYYKLLPLYKSLQFADVQQLHFHTANNHSYLRFHRPDIFGDDLTEFRPSVRYVNAQLTPFHGFEEGKIYNGYRHVFPIIDQNLHLGSVEISNSLLSFKRNYERHSPDSVDFVMLKNVVMQTVFESEIKNYQIHPLHPLLLIQNELQDHDTQYSRLDVDLKLQLFNTLAQRQGLQQAIANQQQYFGIVMQQSKLFSVKLTPLISGVEQQVVGFIISIGSFNLLHPSFSGHQFQLLLFLLISILFAFIINRQRWLLKQTQFLAQHDSLTNLFNRRHFLELVKDKLRQNVLLQAENSKPHLKHRKDHWVSRNYSLIMLDIDHFKRINDTYGHDLGDKALRFISELLKQKIPPDSFCSRWGGEEFMVFYRGSNELAANWAEKFRHQLAENLQQQQLVPAFTCSFGIASLKTTEQLESALKQADEALYEAKAKGRNQIVTSEKMN